MSRENLAVCRESPGLSQQLLPERVPNADFANPNKPVRYARLSICVGVLYWQTRLELEWQRFACGTPFMRALPEFEVLGRYLL